MKKDIQLKLIKHITFLEKELEDWEGFRTLSWEEYHRDRSKRRDVERWIENIVNSSIDIAKIILVSENRPLPDTYKEIVSSLSLEPDFRQENIERLSECVRLRNIISHEYLDIRWNSIKKFIEETESVYKTFLDRVKIYIQKKL